MHVDLEDLAVGVDRHAAAALVGDLPHAERCASLLAAMAAGSIAGAVSAGGSCEGHATIEVGKQVKALDAYVKAVDKSGLLLMHKNAGIPSPI